MSEFSGMPTSEELTTDALREGEAFQVGGAIASRGSRKDSTELQRKPGTWLPLYLELLEAAEEDQGLSVSLGKAKHRALKVVTAYAKAEGMELQHVRQQNGTEFMQVVREDD